MKKDRLCLKTWVFKITLASLMVLSMECLAQDNDSIKSINHVGGAVTVTQNGISLIPSFSLNKPALMFDMSVGNKKLSFEPQFRFALEGKPWAFIFWWRYKLVKTDKFLLNVGAHPAFIFRTVPTTSNGVITETIETHRYFAFEVAPSYFITKDVSVGFYYLQGHGFSESSTKQSHFITLNGNFSNIKLFEKFYMKFNPQAYYLRMDDKDGYYVTATVTIARRDFPLSIQSIVNQAIETDIQAKSDFLWNVSLIYSFSHEYVRK